MWEQNKSLADQVQSLQTELQSLKDNKEKMNQELNDNYQQVTRLKLEVNFFCLWFIRNCN